MVFIRKLREVARLHPLKMQPTEAGSSRRHRLRDIANSLEWALTPPNRNPRPRHLMVMSFLYWAFAPAS